MHDDAIIKMIVDDLNTKAGRHFRYKSGAIRRLIRARIKEGYILDDFQKVHDIKVAEWQDTEMANYLRPETLWCAKHFESYLNQVPVRPPLTDDQKRTLAAMKVQAQLDNQPKQIPQ